MSWRPGQAPRRELAEQGGAETPRKRHRPEEIIDELRRAEVEPARGLKPPQGRREIGVAEQACHRWRADYGGVRSDQARHRKELAAENARPKRLRADAELDEAILREAASGDDRARRGGALS